MAENNEFEQDDFITIIDDDGNEHYFDEIDRIETEDGNRYIAVLEIIDDDEEIVSIEDEDDEGVILLKVLEENGENYLVQIESEEEFNEIGNIFEDRLIERYENENNN